MQQSGTIREIDCCVRHVEFSAMGGSMDDFLGLEKDARFLEELLLPVFIATAVLDVLAPFESCSVLRLLESYFSDLLELNLAFLTNN